MRDNITEVARGDLAAAFRWTARLGMHESVANHFSLAVDAAGRRFLINPNGRHFSRIRARDLLELDADDPGTMNRPDAPDPTAWGLHGAIHRACPHARGNNRAVRVPAGMPCRNPTPPSIAGRRP